MGGDRGEQYYTNHISTCPNGNRFTPNFPRISYNWKTFQEVTAIIYYLTNYFKL